MDLLALIAIRAVHCERQNYFRINSGVHPERFGVHLGEFGVHYSPARVQQFPAIPKWLINLDYLTDNDFKLSAIPTFFLVK